METRDRKRITRLISDLVLCGEMMKGDYKNFSNDPSDDHRVMLKQRLLEFNALRHAIEQIEFSI